MNGIIGLLLGMAVPSPSIARTDVNGLTVSTVDSPDMGPETAICDINGAHPVERYKTVAKAKLGHEKWVKRAKTITSITKLGYSDLVDEQKVTLVREAK